MREMKDSGIAWIGDIPNDWRMVRNKNAFICNKEQVGEKSKATQLLSLTTRGIKKKDIHNAEGKLPESFDTYQFVKENDIIMCLFDLDCSAVFSGISPFNGMISPAYRVLSCKECIEPKYAEYWFRYISDGRKFNHYAKNIRYTLSYEEFSALPLLLPERSQQLCIADYLDRKCAKIDTIIARQQQVIEKLKAYRLSVINEAVTKGLNPDVPMKDSGIEWIGMVPAHWRIVKMKLVASFYNGDRSSKYPSGSDIVDSGVLFVTSNNLGSILLNTEIDSNKYITSEKYDSLGGAKLRIDDIVFCLRGSVGKCSINKVYDNGTIASSLVAIRSTGINPDYLNFVLQSPGVTDIATLNAIGIGSLNLAASDVADVLIPFPVPTEQRIIADYLYQKCNAVDTAIFHRQAIIDKLTAYKKSIIYEVVTGKREMDEDLLPATTVAVVSPELPKYMKAVLMARIIDGLGDHVLGRVQVQKGLYFAETSSNPKLHLETDYARYTHGPFDREIWDYEAIMAEHGWIYATDEQEGTVYRRGEHFNDYWGEYQRLFPDCEETMQRIISFVKQFRYTKGVEKAATLFAVWNDFIIDGVTSPTDEEIIVEVRNHWTENKGEIDEPTWKKSLDRLRAAQFIPQGHGKHTVKWQGGQARG